MFAYVDTLTGVLDLVEISGIVGRVSILALRRHLKVGENFDLVTNWDLNNSEHQREVLRYFEKHKPLVAVMGPTCKPFGRLANYNYWHNHDAWLKSYEEAGPHGRFCGKLARVQDDNMRFFIVEQATGTLLVVGREPMAICVTKAKRSTHSDRPMCVRTENERRFVCSEANRTYCKHTIAFAAISWMPV
jgi:hypothetical protein